MAYWEFLLQKEGDRDWLPLETAHVEISEGRYRIIAHTSYCATPVNIRLSRVLTEQLPPQRKTLRRKGATNANGLMVVIPFTHLTPGQWTLTCASAAAASDESWEFGVQLQVLAIESGMEYWETDLDEASLAEQFIGDVSTATIADPWSTSTSPPPTAAEWEASSVDPEAAFAAPSAIADLPLRLQLQHQALVAQGAAPLSLQGQVTTFSQVEGLAGEGTLWVQLRNPETGAVVYQATQAISIAALPSRFEVAMTLPADSATRLLVGELSLWTASEPPQILAIQGFTVTLNLDALLELVANQAESPSPPDFEDLATPQTVTDTDAAIAAQGDTARVNEATHSIAAPLSPRSVPFRLIYLPTSGLTLPPVIYRPIDKRTVGAPTLPPLSPQSRRDRPQPAAADTEQLPPSKPLTLPPIGSPSPTAAKKVTPPEQPTKAGPPLELPTVGQSSSASPATSPPVEEPSESPETTKTTAASPAAFEPDLQGRFWHRLSALAEEAQKAAADYQAQLEAAGIQTTDPAVAKALQNSGAIAGAPTEPDNPVNYEVVVYAADDPPDTDVGEPLSPSEPTVEVLPPGEPDRQELGTIPQPDWIFPQGELVAGAPLPITIRLPAYPRRLAVKVWVTDIQSRTLVDRPRWLMNWSPTPEGDQTAFLQLQVPLGSIEARFEAITIDLATQQESYKTSEVRAIVPADLPEMGVDEPL